MKVLDNSRDQQEHFDFVSDLDLAEIDIKLSRDLSESDQLDVLSKLDNSLRNSTAESRTKTLLKISFLLHKHSANEDFVSDLIDRTALYAKDDTAGGKALRATLLSFISKDSTAGQVRDTAALALQGTEDPEIVESILKNISRFHQPQDLNLAIANIKALKGTSNSRVLNYLIELVGSEVESGIGEVIFEALVPNGNAKIRNFIARHAVEKPEIAWTGVPNLKTERSNPLVSGLLIRLLGSENANIRNGAALALHGLSDMEKPIIYNLFNEVLEKGRQASAGGQEQLNRYHGLAQQASVVLSNSDSELATDMLQKLSKGAKVFDLRRAADRLRTAS
ncbi:MAG: hypothetical protein R3A13_08090 [Bdellovibrionota bacterium]